jgi:nicotinamide-nucleotide adenylyltransferase
MKKKQYKKGLVIGRFQPFHLGHIHLIKKSLLLCETIVIGIGSSNIQDENNIFTYEQRLQMIELFVHEEKLEKSILKVLPIPDVPDDNTWFEIVQEEAGKVDVVLGNNDWVNGIFAQKGIAVEQIEYLDRVNLEGKKIRALIEIGEKWNDRVAAYVHEVIESK